MCDSCKLGVKVIEKNRPLIEQCRSAEEKSRTRKPLVFLSEHLCLEDGEEIIKDFLNMRAAKENNGMFTLNLVALAFERGHLAGRQEENEAAA